MSHAHDMPSDTRYHAECPVCDSRAFSLLSRVWRNYHRPADFFLDPARWFAECDRCGSVVLLPLVEHADFKAYGEAYYDQGASETTAETHALRHFDQFQKPNYDRVRELLRRTHPSEVYPQWLDVGSVGYPTTFDDYTFTTVEPDARAVRAGRDRFGTGRIHCATLETWSGGAPLDGILFNNSFYCVSTPGRTLARAHALLRPHGRLVITLATFLNGATPVWEDGAIGRIEDVLYGETVLVYYNRHSLTYLAARHGFRLIDECEIPAYGCKTMMAYTFERVDAADVSRDLLGASRAFMRSRWQTCFEGLRRSLSDTLLAINRPATVLAGPLDVMLQAAAYGDLSRIRGAIPLPDPSMRGAVVNGVRLLTWDDVRGLSRRELDVVVCGFRDPDAIVRAVRSALGPHVSIQTPTRQSGMESLDVEFRSARVPSKSFALRRLEGGPTVDLTGRRLVVFGAGAGGREALERLQASGFDRSVVAVCDSDTAKHGTIVGGRAVQAFAELSPETFDTVVIASRTGYAAIASRLQLQGLAEGEGFVSLDHV